MIFVGDERRDVRGHKRPRRQAKQIADTKTRHCFRGIEGDTGVNYPDPRSLYPVLNEHLRHRLGDCDHAVGATPVTAPPEREIDPPGCDEGSAGEYGAHSRQRD
jgi:hypothetical protein